MKELSQHPDAIRSRNWRLNNPEKHRESIKKGYWTHREKRLKDNREYHKANPEKIKARRIKNHDPLALHMYKTIYGWAFPEKQRDRHRKWVASNKELRQAYMRQWRKENKEQILVKKKIDYDLKYNSDPAYKIKYALRNRLWKTTSQACAGKVGSTMDLLGCSMGLFMEYLSAHFKFGMTFSNYGEWHIDHKKPVSKFDLTNAEQQKQCFNFLNLQPLWARDNLSKSNKLPHAIRESREIQHQFA